MRQVQRFKMKGVLRCRFLNTSSDSFGTTSTQSMLIAYSLSSSNTPQTEAEAATTRTRPSHLCFAHAIPASFRNRWVISDRRFMGSISRRVRISGIAVLTGPRCLPPESQGACGMDRSVRVSLKKGEEDEGDIPADRPHGNARHNPGIG